MQLFNHWLTPIGLDVLFGYKWTASIDMANLINLTLLFMDIKCLEVDGNVKPLDSCGQEWSSIGITPIY